MIEKINELKSKVGTPYQMFDENKNYIGCFYPIYFVYPNLPRYPLPSDNHQANYHYGMAKILQSAKEIQEKDLQAGDVVACKFNNELHVALYIGEQRIIHVFRGHTLQISRLKILKDYKCFRVR